MTPSLRTFLLRTLLPASVVLLTGCLEPTGIRILNPVQCDAPLQLCGQECVFVEQNAHHCGACGIVCGDAEICRDGECLEPREVCSDDATLCGDACVELQSDPHHCGACNSPCDQDTHCDEGTCVPSTCDPNAQCDGHCVDLQTDASHCGTCETACDGASACVDGLCIELSCNTGIACDGQCIDPDTTTNHCGGCGQACAHDDTCVDGRCIPTCGGDTTLCDNAYCAELRSSNLDCGACGHACYDSEYCVEGQCVQQCPASHLLCDDYCVNPTYDVDHCGGCGITCDHGCTDGVCNPRPIVVQLATGDDHACALLDDGTLRCWGRNQGGALGDGTTRNRSIPFEVPAMRDVRAVAAGTGSTCIIQSDRTVVCWGNNMLGILGVPSSAMSSSLTPVPIDGPSDVVELVLSKGHACARQNDGAIWCWGSNFYGQHGNGSADFTNTAPAQGFSGLAVTTLATGSGHTCALLANGELRCVGGNGNGELGDGTRSARTQPVAPYDIFAMTSLSDTVAVAAKGATTCSVHRDGVARCWGANNHGQVGIGSVSKYSMNPLPVTDLPAAVAIATGTYFACALSQQGAVHCWGQNNGGQLGNGATTASSSPVPTLLDVPARALSLGGDFACALIEDGRPVCWGTNTYGQLGNGTHGNRFTPNAVVWD